MRNFSIGIKILLAFLSIAALVIIILTANQARGSSVLPKGNGIYFILVEGEKETFEFIPVGSEPGEIKPMSESFRRYVEQQLTYTPRIGKIGFVLVTIVGPGCVAPGIVMMFVPPLLIPGLALQGVGYGMIGLGGYFSFFLGKKKIPLYQPAYLELLEVGEELTQKEFNGREWERTLLMLRTGEDLREGFGYYLEYEGVSPVGLSHEDFVTIEVKEEDRFKLESLENGIKVNTGDKNIVSRVVVILKER